MEKIKTLIGDHIIHILFDKGNIRRFFEKNFLISNEYQQPDLIIEIEDGYGEPFTDYNVKINKTENEILYKRADYLIKVDSNFKSATLSIYDELALKHGLLNLYSSFIVHHNWGLLLHSSCMIHDDYAHIFAGKSGAGKSTAAKLSFPKEILSDEATLLKISPDEITVYNSPFRSELEANNVLRRVKLESIQLLNQSLNNNRYKLTMADGLLSLVDKVFSWPHSLNETRTIINLLSILVKKVNVFELHFKKDNTFWKLIS